jgi:PTS system nitrogen regulatory IIA component
MSTAASRAMKLLDIIRPESIVVPLAATTKHEAIDALKRVVWEREMQRSTGIGEGLAIPHGKCPGLAGLVVAIGKPAEPIEFEAIDQKPVRLVILLASPADRIAEHIQALGRISRTMADPAVRNAAYACDSPAALYEIFRKADA